MASKRIQGIQIPIGADTTPLQKTLAEVNNKSKELNKEFKQINNLLKLDPKNTELLAQKQKLLSDSVLNATDKLKRLKDAQQEVNKLFASGEIDEGQYRAFNREVESAQIKLAKLEEQTKKVNNSLSSTFEETSQKLNTFGTMTTDLGKKLLPLSGAIAGIVTGAVGLAINTGALADDINTLAKVTGLSVEQIQKFQYASDVIDVSLDTLTGSMAKLIRNMESARQGSKNQAEAFDTLGISIIGVDGQLRNNQEVFNETINALGKIENETQRDALAMQIFGKSAQDLNPLILGGADALKQLGDEAEKAGLILSQDALDAANEFNDEIDILKANTKGSFTQLGKQLATMLLPALQDLASKLKNGLSWLNSFDKSTLKSVGSIGLLIAGVAPLLILIGKLSTGIGSIISFSSKLKTSLLGTAESVGLLSKAFTFLSANPIIAVVAGISALCLVLGNSLGLFKSQAQKIEETQQAYANVKSELENVNNELETTNDKIRELQTKGSLTLVEKDELSNLQQSNAELERRKQLLEDAEKIKAKKVNNELYTSYKNDYLSTVSVADDNGVMGAIDITNEEYFKRQVKRYNDLTKLGNAMTEQQKKEYSVIQDELIKTSGEFEDLAEKVIIVDDKSRTFRESLLELSDSAYKALHPDLWKNNKLNEIFNKTEFEKVKNELISLAKVSKLDENSIKSYKLFNNELSKVGVTAKEVIAVIEETVLINNNINDSVKYISGLTDEANVKTMDFSSSVKILSDVYNTLNSKENLSLETLTALIDKYPKYANEISKINDNKESGIKLVNLLFEAEKNEALESLEQTKAKILTENELLNLRLRLAEISKSTWVSQEAYTIYNQIKASENAAERIQALQDSINKSSMLSKNSSSKSSSKDDVSKVYNERISLIENEIFLSEKLQSTIKEGSIKYLNELDKQINKNKELQKLAHDEAERLRNLGYSDNSPEVQNKIKYWWSLNDKNTALFKNKLDSISSNYKEQNQLLEDRIKLLDVEQSKYNNLDNDYIEIEKEKYSIVLEQKQLINKQIEELEKSNIKGAKEKVSELKRVLLDFEQKSINIKKNINESITQNETNYAEKVKNSREKLEKTYIDMQKKRINETKKAYQDEIKWANEVYSTKKSNLQKERDERYRNRNLEDITLNVSSIQAEMDLIKNDETQIARYLELQEELTKAKLELDDTIYDNQYEKRVQALENEQNKLNAQYEYQIGLLDDSLNNEKAMRDEFNRNIERDNKTTYNALIKYAQQYGEITSIEIKDAWDICTNSLDNFNLKQFEVNGNLERMVGTLRQILQLTNEIGKASSNATGINNKSLKTVVPNNGSLSNLATNNINSSTSNSYYETPVNITQGNIYVSGDVSDEKINELKELMLQQQNDMMNGFKKIAGQNKGNTTNFAYN